MGEVEKTEVEKTEEEWQKELTGSSHNKLPPTVSAHKKQQEELNRSKNTASPMQKRRKL